MDIDKKPAHVVVCEMIAEQVKQFVKEYDSGILIPLVSTFTISILFEVLGRMVVPEKHLVDVATALIETRGHCNQKAWELFFKPGNFPAIDEYIEHLPPLAES